MDAATRTSLTHRFDYIFATKLGYPPLLEAHTIPPHGEPWSVEGAGGAIPITTFDQAHGPIRSVGYRLATWPIPATCRSLDEAALKAVAGCQLWIVDALRYTPHPTHAHLDQALEWIAAADVEQAVLTNLHIDMDYKALSSLVPANVEVGFDGWSRMIG